MRCDTLADGILESLLQELLAECPALLKKAAGKQQPHASQSEERKSAAQPEQLLQPTSTLNQQRLSQQKSTRRPLPLANNRPPLALFQARWLSFKRTGPVSSALALFQSRWLSF